jgi:hypothetical protein
MKKIICALFGHRWQNRVGGGSVCKDCRLWQDKRD